jgi:hypothetical protein
MFSETMVGLHGAEPALLQPMTFLNSQRSSMWGVRLVICSLPSSAATQNRVAYFLICHMSLAPPKA